VQKDNVQKAEDKLNFALFANKGMVAQFIGITPLSTFLNPQKHCTHDEELSTT
jgi:hypothetical protein